jgi:hypothetical protein
MDLSDGMENAQKFMELMFHVHYRIYENPPLVLFSRHIILTELSHPLSKIHFNIILPALSKSLITIFTTFYHYSLF